MPRYEFQLMPSGTGAATKLEELGEALKARLPLVDLDSRERVDASQASRLGYVAGTPPAVEMMGLELDGPVSREAARLALEESLVEVGIHGVAVVHA